VPPCGRAEEGRYRSTTPVGKHSGGRSYGGRATLEAAMAVAPTQGRLPDPELVTGWTTCRHQRRALLAHARLHDHAQDRRDADLSSGEKRRLQVSALSDRSPSRRGVRKTRFDTSVQ